MSLFIVRFEARASTLSLPLPDMNPLTVGGYTAALSSANYGSLWYESLSAIMFRPDAVTFFVVMRFLRATDPTLWPSTTC